MSKLALIGAILLGLALPATAAAQPVSGATAARVIQADRWYNVDGSARAVWCLPKRYGTICRVRSIGVCFHDAVFGSAEVVDTVDWWVSRTRGKISDEPVGHNTSAVWVLPVAASCSPGSVAP